MQWSKAYYLFSQAHNLEFLEDIEIPEIIQKCEKKKNRPIEPKAPEPWECCGSGCNRCVLEVYYE